MKNFPSPTLVKFVVIIVVGLAFVSFLIAYHDPTKIAFNVSSSTPPSQNASARSSPIGYGTVAYPPEPAGSISPWGVKKPTIRVFTPGSGETLEVGKTYTIHWTSKGIPERNVSLYLYSYNGFSAPYKINPDAIVESVSLKDGAYEWSVPEISGYLKYSIFISDKGHPWTACYSGEGIPKDCLLDWNFGTSDFFYVMINQTQ